MCLAVPMYTNAKSRSYFRGNLTVTTIGLYFLGISVMVVTSVQKPPVHFLKERVIKLRLLQFTFLDFKSQRCV